MKFQLNPIRWSVIILLEWWKKAVYDDSIFILGNWKVSFMNAWEQHWKALLQPHHPRIACGKMEHQNLKP
jgi:hypothetical protein